MNSKSIFAITFSTVFLAACGGGGSSSGDDEQNTTYVESTPAPTISPQSSQQAEQDTNTSQEDTSTETIIAEPAEEVYDSTAEIIAEEAFLFEGSQELLLDIDIKALVGKRAYLNICRVDETGNIAYQDCLLKSPLRDGHYVGEITIANDIGTLGLAIWQYTPDEPPMLYYWQREQGFDYRLLVDAG